MFYTYYKQTRIYNYKQSSPIMYFTAYYILSELLERQHIKACLEC